MKLLQSMNEKKLYNKIIHFLDFILFILFIQENYTMTGEIMLIYIFECLGINKFGSI